MAISSFSGSTGGGGGALNGFHVYTGTNGYTTFTFEDEQPAGAYWITSQIAEDYVYDIYVASEDGTFSGYTTERLLIANSPIKNVVIYGGTAEDLIIFDYKTTASEQVSGGVTNGVAPFALSVSDSTLYNIDDTTIVTGGNFADDVQVVFTGSDMVARNAKLITKNSPSEIVVTRPDVLPPDYSPYTLTFTNPGIPNPTDGRNILDDIIDSGTYPGWITEADLYWTLGFRTEYPLVATDTEQTDVDYEIVSGALLSGLSLNQETGIISGDDSALIDGETSTFTVRAIDAGGNTADKTFTLTANDILTWVTPSGSLGNANTLGNNEFILETNTGATANDVTYTLTQGSLPPGIQLTENGIIGGVAGGDSGITYTFTITATDNGKIGVDREFSLTTSSTISSWYFDTFATAGGLEISLLNDLSVDLSASGSNTSQNT